MKAPTQRRLQFTLRTLLAFFIVAALLLGYVASTWRAHSSKVALIREIEARGGTVLTEKRGPRWLRQIGAYHHFGFPYNPPIGVLDPVVKAYLTEPEFTEAPTGAETTEEPVSITPVEEAPADEIDPEILEVFIEEAQEELGVIQEFCGHWKKNPGDTEARARLRRSFHTLAYPET